MVTMSATEVRNNISKLWDAASSEPVMIESAGKPIAVVLSPEEYDKLTHTRKPRQAGLGKQLLADLDVQALLDIPIDAVFAEYS